MFRHLSLLALAWLMAGCATTGSSGTTDYRRLSSEISQVVNRKAFAPTGPLYSWESVLAESDLPDATGDSSQYARAMNHALDQLGVSAFELIPTPGAPPKASITWVDSRVALIRIPSLETRFYERRPVERLFEAAFWSRAIVIDLRGTAGSAPGEAAHLAGMVLRSGTPVGKILEPADYSAYLRRLKDEAPNVADAAQYAADRVAALPNRVLPQAYAGEVVVLVDRDTRGAGELVAAAVQHALRGPVMGEATDGYGYETRQARLSGGWVLEYPVGLVFGPDGEAREGQSVVPDIPMDPLQLADPAALWPLLREFGKPLN
ncbi:MAG: hypothetical protein IT368_04185 [Candidatus Hydrogenedentes bacterium]|nr:hypothetical protein [Candidatus Hydrogenedentota bacterium]